MRKFFPFLIALILAFGKPSFCATTNNGTNNVGSFIPGFSLTGVKFPRCSGHNLGSGDNDLYTVPAGKKAFIASFGRYNTSGGTIVNYLELKRGGTYYPIMTNVSTTTGSPSSVTTGNSFVFIAGDSISVKTDASGLNVFARVVEFDASVPLTTNSVFDLSNGNNTLYTVPANKTAIVVNPSGFQLSNSPMINLFISNRSGASRDYIMYVVPSGGSADSTNVVRETISISDANLATQTIASSLSAGDFIVLNTNSGTAGQHAWVTVVEQSSQTTNNSINNSGSSIPGVNFTGVSFPAARINNSGTGDVDVYTVPAGKKAWVMERHIYTAGSNSVFYQQVKISGTYYRLENNTSVNTGTIINLTGNYIYNAGEIVSANITVSGLNVTYAIILFDATVPIRSVRLNSLSSGDNTLYTCPANKTAYLLDSRVMYTGSQTGSVTLINASGLTQNHTLHVVPSGQAVGTDYQITTTLTAISDKGIANKAVYSTLSPGDFININSTLGTAGQYAWVNVAEVGLVGINNSTNNSGSHAPGPVFTNVSYARASGNNIGSGDIDIYTVPTGKRALVQYFVLYNANVVTTVNYYVQVKIGGTYYRFLSTNAVSALTAPTQTSFSYILNEGEILSLNTDASGLNFFMKITIFDATVGYRSVIVKDLANGDNTIYTVPSGKTAFILPTAQNCFANSSGVNIVNGSGSTRAYIPYMVPSGQSVGSSYQVQESVNVNNGTKSSTNLWATMSAGDYVVLNTNSGTAGQNAWVNVAEVPA